MFTIPLVRPGRAAERGKELRREGEEGDGGRRQVGRRAASRAGPRADPGEAPQGPGDPDQGAASTPRRSRGERPQGWQEGHPEVGAARARARERARRRTKETRRRPEEPPQVRAPYQGAELPGKRIISTIND